MITVLKENLLLYIQIMIQLVENYPVYKQKAKELSKDKLKFLTDSENDKKLILTYNQIVLDKY